VFEVSSGSSPLAPVLLGRATSRPGPLGRRPLLAAATACAQRTIEVGLQALLDGGAGALLGHVAVDSLAIGPFKRLSVARL